MARVQIPVRALFDERTCGENARQGFEARESHAHERSEIACDLGNANGEAVSDASEIVSQSGSNPGPRTFRRTDVRRKCAIEELSTFNVSGRRADD